MEFATRDLEYQRPDGEPLLARLYQPSGMGPFPALLEVHGGAWTKHDRTRNAAIGEALAASGIVMLSIDFRMPPAHRYPVAIADINLGIRWLKAHAADFGSRSELVGGIGTSSGGHQLMLSALRPRDPRYAALTLPGDPDTDASLPYAIACWSVLDPLTRYRMAREKGIANLLEGHHAYWPSEADMAEGNPQLILARGEAVELPSLLLIQGTADDNLTPDMSDRFAEAYRRAGGEAQLEIFEGEPHAFITNVPSPNTLLALERIKSFVFRQAFRIAAL